MASRVETAQTTPARLPEIGLRKTITATELVTALKEQKGSDYVYTKRKPAPHLFFSQTPSNYDDREKLQCQLRSDLIVPTMDCYGVSYGLSILDNALDASNQITAAHLAESLSLLADCESMRKFDRSAFHRVWEANAGSLTLIMPARIFNLVRRLLSWLPSQFDRPSLDRGQRQKFITEALAHVHPNERTQIKEAIHSMETSDTWESSIDWEDSGGSQQLLKLLRELAASSQPRILPPPSVDFKLSAPSASKSSSSEKKSRRKEVEKKDWRHSLKLERGSKSGSPEKSPDHLQEMKGRHKREKSGRTEEERKSDTWEAAKKKRSTTRSANPKRASAPTLFRPYADEDMATIAQARPMKRSAESPRLVSTSRKKREQAKH